MGGRRPCCSKVGLNRGAWSAHEDKILTDYIKAHGEGQWRDLPMKAGLKRCGKSCRLRWLNYLRPDIKRGNISLDEEDLIIRLHKLLGNRWSLIAGRLPGRTDNEIKNYWNTKLSKELKAVPQRLNGEKVQNKLNEQYSHPLIRTKAVRCTKVCIPPHKDDKITAGGDLEPRSGEHALASTLEEDGDHPSNFLADFDDIEELLLRVDDDDDNDFSQVWIDEPRDDLHGAGGQDGCNVMLSPCFDLPCQFREAMLEEWRDGDGSRLDLVPEIPALDSLLQN